MGYATHGSYISYNASTPSSFLSMDFLTIVTLDEVDYAMNSNPDSGVSFIQGNLSYFSPSTIVVACRSGYLVSNPYWTNLTYDPTMVALFTEANSFGTPKPSHNRLNPAAYVVPIVLVAVIVVIVLFMFVPAIRQTIMKPHSRDASRAQRG